MRTADFVRLFGLAAIWGASFLFIRIVAPVLGPLWTAETRVGVAACAMVLVLAATGGRLELRANWKPYLILGTLNSALPFALFAFAGMTLPAGYLAIVNATTPLWGALIGAALLGEKLNGRKVAGLACGIAGVSFLVRLGPAQFTPQLLLAALACVAAAISYGFAGVYTKKLATGIAPPLMATGSQIGAALALLPFLSLAPARAPVTVTVAACVLMLALLCTAFAYVIYFRLIADLGPTKALTVTFLIPLFALVWAALFLGETVNANTLLGCAMVVLATWLVVFPGKPAVAPESR